MQYTGVQTGLLNACESHSQSVDFLFLFVRAFDVLIAMGMLRDFWNNFNSEHKSCRVEVIGIN